MTTSLTKLSQKYIADYTRAGYVYEGEKIAFAKDMGYYLVLVIEDSHMGWFAGTWVWSTCTKSGYYGKHICSSDYLDEVIAMTEKYLGGK